MSTAAQLIKQGAEAVSPSHRTLLWSLYSIRGLTSLIRTCLQRVYALPFGGREAIAKERFTKAYRHPVLDEKLTQRRVGQVRFYNLEGLRDGARLIRRFYCGIP